MGASHETQLRLCILLFPDHRIALIDPLKFRIIYHVDFCILRNQIFSVFYSLRSDIFHMVQTYRTVGSSRCAEVFQIGLCCIIQFTAQTTCPVLRYREHPPSLSYRWQIQAAVLPAFSWSRSSRSRWLFCLHPLTDQNGAHSLLPSP